MGLVQEARAFAVEAHGRQLYGHRPYSFHLDEVAAVVLEVTTSLKGGVVTPSFSENGQAVAYLHDVVEDTDRTLDEISNTFGGRIALSVAWLTDPPGKNRKERKDDLYRRLSILDPSSEVDRIVLTVKPSDRLCNVRNSASDSPSLLEMYRREAKAFRAATYRPGVCDGVWAEIDSILGS